MVTEIVILALLKLGPTHGYEIKKHIESILRRRTRMNTNLLYPALHRLEKQAAIRRQVREQRGRPAKHLYSLTPRGEALFQELIEHFDDVEATKEDEFLARVAFFDFLDEASRLRVLDARRRELRRREEHHGSLHTAYRGFYDSPWVQRIADFSEKQAREEMAWLQELETQARSEPRGTRPRRRAP